MVNSEEKKKKKKMGVKEEEENGGRRLQGQTKKERPIEVHDLTLLGFILPEVKHIINIIFG